MRFLLTGFSQTANVRRYTFQGVTPDQTRQEVTIGVDLNLIRQYGISLQELPLLCLASISTRNNLLTRVAC